MGLEPVTRGRWWAQGEMSRHGARTKKSADWYFILRMEILALENSEQGRDRIALIFQKNLAAGTVAT